MQAYLRLASCFFQSLAGDSYRGGLRTTQMQPEVDSFILDFLLLQLKSEQAITHKIIASVPLYGEQYKPGPKSMTAFQLVRHIAICELWF